MKSLTDYSSFRQFLRDFLREKKSTTPPLTLEKFARKVDMSTSALQMIISGSRNITVHKIHDLAVAIGLKEPEQDFFETLVHFEQAKGRREKKFYERRLSRLQQQSGGEIRRVASRELLAEWYIPSILVYLTDLVGDPDIERLCLQLNLDPDRTRSIITRLEANGLIKRTGPHIHIVYDRVAANYPKEQFLIKVAQEAQRRIKRDFKAPGNYFEAHTLPLCPERFLELVAEYRYLLQKYIDLGPNEGTEPRIYQALQVFFPTL